MILPLFIYPELRLMMMEFRKEFKTNKTLSLRRKHGVVKAGHLYAYLLMSLKCEIGMQMQQSLNGSKPICHSSDFYCLNLTVSHKNTAISSFS